MRSWRRGSVCPLLHCPSAWLKQITSNLPFEMDQISTSRQKLQFCASACFLVQSSVTPHSVRMRHEHALLLLCRPHALQLDDPGDAMPSLRHWSLCISHRPVEKGAYGQSWPLAS